MFGLKPRRQYSKRYPSRRSNSISIRPYLRLLIPMLLAGLLVGFSYWGWRQLMKPNTLPFRHIEIVAKETHLKSSALQKIAWNHLQGGFFSLKIDKLKQALLAIPWVADVSLRRHWPNTLTITVTEQQPVARWGDKGVINDHGAIFYPSPKTIPRTLSILKGPIDNEKEIIVNYQKLNEDAAVLGLRIRSLDVSLRLSYRIVLSNGMLVILGREDIVQRFNRFVQLYPRLIGRKSDQVLRVDLNYPNGLAIRWKNKKTKSHHKKQ